MDENKKTVPISVRMFSSLMGLDLIDSRDKERRIDGYMQELRHGDFSHIGEFENLVDDILNNVLERIKEYAGQDENTKIECIRSLIHDFFRYHIFDHLDGATVKEIKHDFQRDLEKLVTDIMKESKQEERILHRRIPLHWVFRNYLRAGTDYGRKATHDISKEIQYQEEEESLYREVSELMDHLKEYEESGDPDDHGIREKVKGKLLDFARLLMHEYQALFDVEMDVELHENDLVQDIDLVMHKAKEYPDVLQRLEALKKKIEEHCHEHFKIAKSRAKKAQEIFQDFRKR